MRIKTKLNISAAIPILLVSMLVIVLIFLSISVERQLKMSELSSKLAKATADLTLITQEYTIYHEDRMAQQWLSRFNSITKLLQEKELASLRKLSTNVETLNFSFKQLQENNVKFKALSKMERSSEVKNTLEFWQQRLEAQIRLHAQEILESTFRLSSQARDQAIAIQEKSRLLIGSIVIVVILIIAISTYIIIRSILNPLKQLGESVNQIGAGDLEKTVPILGKDEFGSLAMNFEDMRLKLKSAVETIKESEERYAMAQISANIGSWDWNILSGDLQWSEQIEPIFGFKPGEFKRTYEAFMECVHPDDREYVTSSVQSSLDDLNAVYDIEHRIIWPSGEVHWVSEKGQVYRDDKGVPIRMLGVVQDITTRKNAELELETYRGHLEELVQERTDELEKAKDMAERAEEAANEANAAKSMFLARMSHEIRTPMNAVLGMLYLTKKTDLTTVQKNYIDKSHNAAESLLRVINDILDFSKIEAGKLEIDFVDFEFNEMISRVSSVMSFKAEEKGVELLVRYDNEIPPFLIGDPVRIEQILINLIGNAIKFTAKGEVILSSKLIEKTKDKINLMFCIKDSGIGISKKDQEKLFKEFSQADVSTTRRFGGSGLGLVISKKLTNMMDGKIWIEESKEGCGSTFCFTLKCKYSNLSSKPKRFVPEFMDNLNVLIVDDNPIACKILSELLTSLKIKSSSVNSGEEAIETLVSKKEKYDLVIMDFKMGGLNGLETFQRLQDQMGESLPKTIMVSAYSHEEILSNVSSSGLQGFITKPVSPSVLYDSIMTAYNKKEINEQEVETTTKEEFNVSALVGSHILLVEDNLLNQEFATILLKDNGIMVDIANDGLEALELIKTKKYNAVLMDIQMPNMDGLEATMKIREMGNKDNYFKEVPIIAMTAHAMSGDMEKSISSGMNDHVTKPIDPDKLFSALLKFIEPNTDLVLQKDKKEKVDYVEEFENSSIPTPLNMNEALKRVAGNKKALLSIMKRFSEHYGNIYEKIDNLIENGKLIEAEKKVHEIKGVSGNISATKLFKVLVEIDTLLKKEQKPQKMLMEEFKVSLDEVIEYILSLKEESTKSIKSFDKNKVVELLNIIDKNLEENIIKSEDALNELLPYIVESEYKDYSKKISESISNFDTDEASMWIVKFKKELEG